MNFVRFLKDFFHVDGSGNTSVKYAQGQTYLVSDETASQVVAGSAELVEAGDAPPPSQAPAQSLEPPVPETPVTTA